jgi:hypothetical protein
MSPGQCARMKFVKLSDLLQMVLLNERSDGQEG